MAEALSFALVSLSCGTGIDLSDPLAQTGASWYSIQVGVCNS